MSKSKGLLIGLVIQLLLLGWNQLNAQEMHLITENYGKVVHVPLDVHKKFFASEESGGDLVTSLNGRDTNLTKERYGGDLGTSFSNWSFSIVGGGKAAEGVIIYEAGVQIALTLFQGNRLRLEGLVRDSSRELDMQWGNYNLAAFTDMKTLMGALSYEWFPFVGNTPRGKFMRSLKLKAGVYYLDNPEYAFEASLEDEVRWGDVIFTTEEIGLVKTTVETQNVQSFLGLGYDTYYAGKRINLVFEGGLSYHGKPKVTMEATNMLRPTATQSSIVEDNLNGYRYMPFLQLSLQYNL